MVLWRGLEFTQIMQAFVMLRPCYGFVLQEWIRRVFCL